MSFPPLGNSTTTVAHAITQFTGRHHPELYNYWESIRNSSLMANYVDIYPSGKQDEDYKIPMNAFVFGLRREFRFMGGDGGSSDNSIGQQPFVSASLCGMVVPRVNGVVDFDRVLAIPDQVKFVCPPANPPGPTRPRLAQRRQEGHHPLGHLAQGPRQHHGAALSRRTTGPLSR